MREGEHVGTKDLKTPFSKGAFLNEYEKAESRQFHIEETLAYSTRRAPISLEFMRKVINFLRITLPGISDHREAGALIGAAVQLINAKYLDSGESKPSLGILEELDVRIGDSSPDLHRVG